jgi:multidrug efflux pump subunit AcrA (membrane-fusion protein)
MKRFIPHAQLSAALLAVALLGTDRLPVLAQTTDAAAPSRTGNSDDGGGAKAGKAKRHKKVAAAGTATAEDAKKKGAAHQTPGPPHKEKSSDPEKKNEKKLDKKSVAGSESKSETCKVKKQRFKIDVTLEGLFEAARTAEVLLRAKEWSDFEVLTAVEHGSRVKQGDLLVSLDTEKIDRAIADLQREQALSRVSFQESQIQLAAVKAARGLDLAASERGKRFADEDLRFYLDVERSMNQRVADFNLKQMENNLAYQKEELRQLEKMYKADDLVEETEEIVLKRTRDTVEALKFMVDYYKVQRERAVKFMLPRSEEMLKTSTQRQDQDLAKTRALLPLAEQKLELALEKMKVESARSDERLQKLQGDRAAMTVKAPASGVVYYGRCVRGKWSGAESIGEKLRRGGRLSNEEVFMTIVETRPLTVRTQVSEKQIQHVRAGLKAIVRPTGFTDLKLPAIVQSVGSIPLGSKEFDARLTVAWDDAAAAVVPGMTCDVKVLAYQKAGALVLPLSAVGSDDGTSPREFVALPGKDGKPKKHEVTTGKRNEKQVEILRGLAAGDEVLQEYPKDLE